MCLLHGTTRPLILAAGRVYDSMRAQAYRKDADTDYAIRIGRVAGLRIMRRLQASVVNAYRNQRTFGRAIDEAYDELAEVSTKAMLWAFLRGRQRATKEAIENVGPIEAKAVTLARTPALDQAIRFLIKRQTISDRELDVLERKADAHLVRIMAGEKLAVQRKLMDTIRVITEKGQHVREGIKTLKKSFDALGLTQQKPHELEAIFRTQTQLAYSAGQEAVFDQPEIDEILWGFTYATVGDNRVRPEHAALDGVTLPKDHSFWRENTPPNGWNCRCQKIALYEPRALVYPPDSIEFDGQTFRPGADEGFRFNPGDLLAA